MTTPPNASAFATRCHRLRFRNCPKIPATGSAGCRPPAISSIPASQKRTSSGHAVRSGEGATWSRSCRVLGGRVKETILQYLVEKAGVRGISEIIGRYIPPAKNGLVRDHFSKLGFVQTGSQNGETTWQLAIAGYGDKNLPLKVALPRD